MKITFGRSVQVFEIGKPESWNKFTVEDDIQSWETRDEAVERLVGFVNSVHEKHSQGNVDTFSYPVQKKTTKIYPDAEIRKQYAIAVASMNKEKVEQLESIYNFQIGG